MVSIFGYSILTALALSIIAVMLNNGFRSANLYLGGFLFFSTLVVHTLVLCIYFPQIAAVLFAGICLLPLFFLIGPMAFFYVRSILTNDTQLKKRDYLHFLPFVVQVAGYIPFYLSSWEHKMTILSILQSDHWNLSQVNPNLIPTSVNLVFRILYELFYLGWIVVMFVWKYRLFFNGSASEQPSWKKSFVLIFTGFLIFQSFITGYFTIHHFIYTTRSGFLAHSSVVILISGLSPALFSLFLLLYPSMLYGLSGKNLHHIHPSGRVVESDTSPLKVSGHGATDQPFQSVVTIAVEDQTEWPEPRDLLDKVEIEAVLKTLINGKNIFPDQNFTIYSLAIALEIPVHRLRTYFHVRGESFSEFRNRLRVERAKELLKSGESKRFTLEAIGNMSGFSSNVSFFNEFRKITGTSPMQYAREHQAKIIA